LPKRFLSGVHVYGTSSKKKGGVKTNKKNQTNQRKRNEEIHDGSDHLPEKV